MRQQRGAIGPLLDKHQPQRIFAIDMHGVRDASSLLARAMDMLEAQFANRAEGIFPGRHTAGHYDHGVTRSRFRYRQGIESPALAKSIGCCGQLFSAACPASVSM